MRVRDSEGLSWQIECLGEPVVAGARISFVALAGGDDPSGVMLRLLVAGRASWICTLRRRPDGLQLIAFGGVEAPEMELSDSDSKGAPDGSRVRV
ncbi:MAG: hypothetical protein VCB25_10260, partial [Myxococcota bacterium]